MNICLIVVAVWSLWAMAFGVLEGSPRQFLDDLRRFDLDATGVVVIVTCSLIGIFVEVLA